MNPKLLLSLAFAAALLALPAWAQTNSPAITNNDTVMNGYLQIQEQLHATQMAIEDIRAAGAVDAKRNADAIAARLESLEQSVAAQRNADTESARRTQQLTLLLAGAFGLAGLGIMALMFYFQWRAFTRIAEISAQQNAALANAGAVHQLAAPGRAAVATSNSRLLDVVGQLERKIIELENGSSLLVEAAGTKPLDLLAEGQTLLDAGQPHKALEVFRPAAGDASGPCRDPGEKISGVGKTGTAPGGAGCL